MSCIEGKLEKSCDEHFDPASDVQKSGVEFIYSQRGKKMLVHNNYKYSFHRPTKGYLQWRCYMRNCSAKLFTDTEESQILGTQNTHCHKTDTHKIVRHIISTRAKEFAVEMPDKPPGSVLEEIQDQLSVTLAKYQDRMSKQDINLIKRSVYNARKRVPQVIASTQHIDSILGNQNLIN